jgi:hypothetical protein
MKTKILVIPLIAVIMVFATVGLGYALSPYVPNYYSYDPEWTGALPKFGGSVDAYLTYSQQYDGQYNDLDAKKVAFTLDRAELHLQHRATGWADGYLEVSITAFEDTQISLDEAWLRVVVPWGSGSCTEGRTGLLLSGRGRADPVLCDGQGRRYEGRALRCERMPQLPHPYHPGVQIPQQRPQSYLPPVETDPAGRTRVLPVERRGLDPEGSDRLDRGQDF